MKVSVIVPVYNVEKYLAKCLDSLVNQTLKEIEIIVVNDGTKDNSQKIIDKYSKKYKQIKAYKKENGGQSSARNYGLSKATGEYIGFTDGDDYVSPDMYEKMYQKAKSGNFDIVACDLNYVYEDNRAVRRISSGIDNDTYDIRKILPCIYPIVCNSIFKRELFKNKITFKEGVWFEDVEFIYRMLTYIKSIGVVKEPFVQYLQREGSVTKSIDPRIYDYIDNWNDTIEFYKKRKLYDKYRKELEFCYVRYIYATFIKQATNFNKEEYKKAVNRAIPNVKKHFPHYHKNSYFYGSVKGIYLLLFNRQLAKLVYKRYHRELGVYDEG